MEQNSSPSFSSDADQLKKYADDLAKVYRSEKEKRKELQTANEQLVKFADDLNRTVKNLRVANRDLQSAYLDTIHRLVLAAEYKDEDTGDHIVRMSRYSSVVAEDLGLPENEVENILYAAPMHDVGKIGIPDNILLKPGKLTDVEFDTMKTHTSIGAKILANSKAEILRLAQQIAISHHEKWNGKGYPQGLSGDKIPMVGRIVGIADVFDALTTRRPYKDPYPVEVALDIIRKERGEHFDPAVVDVFLENIDDILRIREEVGSLEDISLADFMWSDRDKSMGLTPS
ncbi:MAG: HD domain-containing protein [Deltaproteobacteria bacterium]|uniref:HD domain-containing protein n=1 Tax=Candidatus Desulfacyla euxinica TaxID=2841693 RepID=A0A8J6N2B2_9DELT|nr:HD domain-containing protein [Candidatus Desulfacyla euxinica]MBL7218002.1 HD domain-containing protein [Desulfobacteraceae bacterium]